MEAALLLVLFAGALVGAIWVITRALTGAIESMSKALERVVNPPIPPAPAVPSITDENPTVDLTADLPEPPWENWPAPQDIPERAPE